MSSELMLQRELQQQRMHLVTSDTQIVARNRFGKTAEQHVIPLQIHNTICRLLPDCMQVSCRQVFAGLMCCMHVCDSQLRTCSTI